ncbi:MAG: sugar-binding domain-containing protein, partial [Verrucomicrobiota bacterium]
MKSSLSRFLFGLIIWGLVAGRIVSGAEFSLETRKPYSFAEEIIPGFPKQPLAESWILNPVPTSWKTTSLDGEWNSKFIESKEFLDYFNKELWILTPDQESITNGAIALTTKTKVPWAFASTSFPGGPKDSGTMWYSRDFSTPAFDRKKERLFVRFNGAGYRMEAWVNGILVGEHLGPYVKIDLDITDAVKAGDGNHLVVRTVDTRFGQSWCYKGYTGLYESVQLQVRPQESVQGLRLAPKWEAQRLDFDFKPEGFKTSDPGTLTVEVRRWPDGTQKFNTESKVAINEQQRFSGQIAMPEVQMWSPEHPTLYIFALKWNGVEIARERFGFREISIQNAGDRQHIYLNGKRTYLRIQEFGDMAGGFLQEIEGKEEFCPNEKGYARKLLMAMKYANINCFRPHSGYALMDQTFFNLCDELGIIVYLDWPFYRHLTKEGDPKLYNFKSFDIALPLFREVIQQYHNHPSLGMVSMGNELFNFTLPKGKSYVPAIEKYHAAFQEEDLQKRPTTGSAGGTVLVETTPLEVVDTHQYIGVYANCSIAVEGYLKDTVRTILGRYQKSLPFISTETGFVSDMRQHDSNFKTWAPTLKSPDFDRKAFAKKTQETSNGIVSWALVCANSGGLRCYLTNFPEWRRRSGIRVVKRYFDLYRRNHQITDGVSCNTCEGSIATYYKGSSVGIEPERWVGVTTPKLMLADPFWDFRESFQPILPIVTVETPHPISGMPFKGLLTLVNDSEEALQAELTIQFRDSTGNVVLKQPPLSVQAKQGEEFISNLEIPLPGNLKSGWYQFELYVHQG